MIIGLTGGICTGKTTAGDALEQAGGRVLDCDEIAHFIAEYEPEIRQQIRAAFGAEVFHSGGALLRRSLGAVVMSNPELRRELECIIHPTVQTCVYRNVQEARKADEPLVVIVPLLFEAGWQDIFDETWCIACKPEVQLARLQTRLGIGEEEARRWLGAQLSIERKAGLATRVFTNNDKIEVLQCAVRSAWEATLNK